MDPRIRLITQAVVTNKGELSANEAASRIGLCEAHFLRLFKLEVGTTFRRFKRSARIALATRLLADHTQPLKQIAGAAGYEDASNFHRDFKKVHEMTPRQWRLMELAQSALSD